MALKKQINEKGFECEYWIIADIHSMKKLNLVTFTVLLFKDAVSRQASIDNFILTKHYRVSDSNKSKEDLYVYLKTLPEFSGAEDC